MRLPANRMKALSATGIFLITLLTLLTLATVSGCGASPHTPLPAIYYPQQYQWQQELPTHRLNIPITPKSPGKTVATAASHRLGLGLAMQGGNLSSLIRQVGLETLADETTQLHKGGWTQLFPPVLTGAYPAFVFYVTYKSHEHYCFVEYSSLVISPGEASQQLDIYYV